MRTDSTPTKKKIQKAMRQRKNANKNSDYTIADRPRTVSLSYNSHPTGVVKPVYGLNEFNTPILNRIELTIWTIYTFLVMNTHL